jgi:Terminase RNaseH-like domain/Terminase large subunit, T4likevirus-type, N-terminal
VTTPTRDKVAGAHAQWTAEALKQAHVNDAAVAHFRQAINEGHVYKHPHHGLDAAALGDRLAKLAAQTGADGEIHWLFEPHAAQQQILDCTARFITVKAGRRTGKTWIACRWIVERLQEAVAAGDSQAVAWWVAPTYQASMRALRDVLKLLPRKYRVVKRGEKAIELLGGGRIEFHSADNPDALRGEGLVCYVADEAAYIAEYVYTDVLDPMLTTTHGRRLLISTPAAKAGYFYEQYQLTERGDETDYASFSFPTSCNTAIPGIADEVKRLRRTMPELSFKREILAEFLDSLNTPLAGAREVAYLEALTGPKPGRRYAAGIDWARSFDFTVVSIWDVQSNEQVALYRWTGIKYEDQLARIREIAGLWRLEALVAETNNMGAPLVERLADEGLPMVPFTTTNRSKTDAIRCLELAINTKTLALLADEVQLVEMTSFEEVVSETGTLKMSAAGRGHDDCVMADAFVWYYLHGNDPDLNAAEAEPFDGTRKWELPPQPGDWVGLVGDKDDSDDDDEDGGCNAERASYPALAGGYGYATD